MSKKLIICFEGIEGSGKSLHLKSVAFFLKKKNTLYKTKRTWWLKKF